MALACLIQQWTQADGDDDDDLLILMNYKKTLNKINYITSIYYCLHRVPQGSILGPALYHRHHNRLTLSFVL